MKRYIGKAIISMLIIAGSASCANAFCFEEAGEMYGIAPELLRAIAEVESGQDPHAVNYANNNGSYDFGIMQINSSWEKRIGRELWMSLGDPCMNVKVGAWVLATCIRQYGYVWEAVGCYNAVSSEKRKKYIKKVGQALKTLKKKAPASSKMAARKGLPNIKLTRN